MPFEDTNPLETGANMVLNKVLCNPYLGGEHALLCPDDGSDPVATLGILVIIALVSTIGFTYTANLADYAKKDKKLTNKPVAWVGVNPAVWIGSALVLITFIVAIVRKMKFNASFVADDIGLGLALSAMAAGGTFAFTQNEDLSKNATYFGAGLGGLIAAGAGVFFAHKMSQGRAEVILAATLMCGAIGSMVGGTIGQGWGKGTGTDDQENSVQTKAFGATWNKIFGTKYITYYIITICGVMALAQGIALLRYMGTADKAKARQSFLNRDIVSNPPSSNAKFPTFSKHVWQPMKNFAETMSNEEFSELSSLSSLARKPGRFDLSSIGSL